MRNERFQLAVMNDTEPGASDIAAFENDLRSHRVTRPDLQRTNFRRVDDPHKKLAEQNGIAVVGVSETEPPNVKYQNWMMRQLTALDAALGGKVH